MYSAAVVPNVLLRRWEPWRRGVQWLAIRSWQRPVERIIKTASLRATWEVAQELNIDHSVIIQHWKKLKRWKDSLRGVSWADPKSKQTNKKSSFWSGIFSYFMQQWAISCWDCDMQRKVHFIQQPATSSSVVGPRSSKALPKVKLAPKKSHGPCLVSDPL